MVKLENVTLLISYNTYTHYFEKSGLMLVALQADRTCKVLHSLAKFFGQFSAYWVPASIINLIGSLT